MTVKAGSKYYITIHYNMQTNNFQTINNTYSFNPMLLCALGVLTNIDGINIDQKQSVKLGALYIGKFKLKAIINNNETSIVRTIQALHSSLEEIDCLHSFIKQNNYNHPPITHHINQRIHMEETEVDLSCSSSSNMDHLVESVKSQSDSKRSKAKLDTLTADLTVSKVAETGYGFAQLLFVFVDEEAEEVESILFHWGGDKKPTSMDMIEKLSRVSQLADQCVNKWLKVSVHSPHIDDNVLEATNAVVGIEFDTLSIFNSVAGPVDNTDYIYNYLELWGLNPNVQSLSIYNSDSVIAAMDKEKYFSTLQDNVMSSMVKDFVDISSFEGDDESRVVEIMKLAINADVAERAIPIKSKTKSAAKTC